MGENGITWVEAPGRNADIYVFGLHPITDDSADHRNPDQWLFYAVQASSLPDAKSIGRPTLERLSPPVTTTSLNSAVQALI